MFLTSECGNKIFQYDHSKKRYQAVLFVKFNILRNDFGNFSLFRAGSKIVRDRDVLFFDVNIVLNVRFERRANFKIALCQQFETMSLLVGITAENICVIYCSRHITKKILLLKSFAEWLQRSSG